MAHTYAGDERTGAARTGAARTGAARTGAERTGASGAELTVAANALAAAISGYLTVDEQNVVGNLLTLVGTSMLTIAAINQSRQESRETDENAAAAP